MKRAFFQCILLLVLGVLSGCVSGGHKFSHGRYGELDLYRVKKSEYAGMFGQPFKISDMYSGSDKYQVVLYQYAYRPFAGNLLLRSLLLEYKNDDLNGFLYVSTYREDRIDVDIHKVKNVKIGVSTKDDVVSALGKPRGKASCPTELTEFKDRCTKAKEVWGWLAIEFGYANKVVQNKYIFIMFGEDDRVVDLKAGDMIN